MQQRFEKEQQAREDAERLETILLPRWHGEQLLMIANSTGGRGQQVHINGRSAQISSEAARTELDRRAAAARVSLTKQNRKLRNAAQIPILQRQIRELSAIISSKEQSLYTDTLNERAPDRLHESMQRDKERLVTLTVALDELEKRPNLY